MTAPGFAGWIILAVVPTFFASFVLIGCWVEDEFYDWNGHFKKKIGIPIISICMSIIIGCMFPGIFMSQKVKYDSWSQFEYNIVSLERSSEVEGHFFIGSGHVNGTQYYYYYRETDKGYKLEKARTDYTYLIETDTITPSLYLCKDSGEIDSYYKIYCPVGTIIKEYKA